MRKFLISVFVGAILAPALVLAAGNTANDSFTLAGKCRYRVLHCILLR